MISILTISVAVAVSAKNGILGNKILNFFN